VEKRFLLFESYRHDEQALSARELEFFGALEPFLFAWADNPY
jgi:hypothetical protein